MKMATFKLKHKKQVKALRHLAQLAKALEREAGKVEASAKALVGELHGAGVAATKGKRVASGNILPNLEPELNPYLPLEEFASLRAAIAARVAEYAAYARYEAEP